MIPARYAYVWPYAAGNDATCTAQAFLFNFFSMSGGWCNVLLAFTCKDMFQWFHFHTVVMVCTITHLSCCCYVCLLLLDYLTVCRQKSETELRSWKYQVLILGWPWFFGLVAALVNIIVGGGGKVMEKTWSCEAWGASWAFYFTTALIGLGLLIILFSMGSLIRVSELNMNPKLFNIIIADHITYKGFYLQAVYVQEKRMDRFSSQ